MTRILFILMMGFLSLTACDKVFEAEPENNPVALFEYLWTDFDQHYGPFEERQIDWDELYDLYRPQVSASMNDEELYGVITSMLGHLDDGHINLTVPHKKVFNANFIRNHEVDKTLFDLEMIKINYLEHGFKSLEDDGYVYGKIKGQNIGYIYFDYVSDNFFALHDFLNDHATSLGIIIDLRHNQGGDFTYCFSEMGRLVDQEREVFQSRTKNGPGKEDYTPWYSWSISPSGVYFNKPIVVLTDRYTISAGERSVMALSILPNVTVIGDTTCGAHSTVIGRELANGWYYSVSTQNTRLTDGQSYEGIGLAPDIVIKNLQSEIDNGIDRTLQAAIDRF